MKILENLGFNFAKRSFHSPEIDIESSSKTTQEQIVPATKIDKFEGVSGQLDDTDSNILNKSLIQYLPTDSLRLELQLENAEKKLKDTEKEIKLNKMFQLDTENTRVQEIENRQRQIQAQIQGFRMQYRELGIVYKIADTVNQTCSKAEKGVEKIKIAFMSNPVISKIIDKIPGQKEKMMFEHFNLVKDELNTATAKKAKKNSDEIIALLNQANKIEFGLKSKTEVLENPAKPPFLQTLIDKISLFADFAGKKLTNKF